MLAEAYPAGADILQRGIEVLVQRQPLGVRSADQDAFHGNLIDRCRDRAARGLNFDSEMARQPRTLASVFALALPQQYRAARFEFLCKRGDGAAGLGDVLAMSLGLPGRTVDFGGAVADRDDELRCGGGVVGHLAGGFVLLRYRAVDVLENRADRRDRQRNPLHGIDRARRVALQRVDPFGNLLGGVLGLHRQRLDLGGDHGKAAPGITRPRRLDGGVERQKRGLPGDLRDQIDDIADGSRRFAQATDIEAGLLGGGAGLVGELAGVAHLGPDALRGMGEVVRGLRKGGRGALRGAGMSGQRVGALSNGGERRRRRLCAIGDRMGRAFELPDHGAELELEQFEDFPGGIAIRNAGYVSRDRRRRRNRYGGRRGRIRQTLSKQSERHWLISKQAKETACSQSDVKPWLIIARWVGNGRYPYTERPGKSLISGGHRPITPRLPPHHSARIPEASAWPDIPSSRTSCTARAGRMPRSRNCSASWRGKSPSRPRWASRTPA